jgi:pantetheine-phosphate adenylyltransferase
MEFCDHLIIGIGVNSSKKTMFSELNRIQMISESVSFLSKRNNITVTSFEGLLVNFAKQEGAKVLIRGIRNVSDFEYEINLANINKTVAPGIDTIFLPTSPELAVVSSSMVKEISKHGGDVSRFVPKHVDQILKSRFVRD